MMKNSTFLLLTFFSLLFNPAAAQWTATAPFHPTATRSFTRAVVVAPNGNLVVAGRGIDNAEGLYFSTNGGASWTQTGQNLPAGITMYSFCTQGAAVFLATTAGIFASLDNGATWATRGTGLPPNTSFYALRSINNVLLAGIENPDRVSTANLVYRSTDNGLTWTTASTGIPASTRNIGDFASDGRGAVISFFYGSGGNVIFRSTDNGATWTSTTSGVPGNFLPSTAGTVGNTLLIGSGFGRGVIRSTDGGLTWAQANTGLDLTSTGVFTSFATYGNTVYVCRGNFQSGFYASTDGGLTWTPDNNGLPGEFTQLLVHNNLLYAGLISTSVNRGLYYRQLGSPMSVAPAGIGSAQLQIFPNPARQQGVVRYHLSQPGLLTLEVFDGRGSRVATLARGWQAAGDYTLPLAKNLPPGVYHYRLQAGAAVLTRRLLVLE